MAISLLRTASGQRLTRRDLRSSRRFATLKAQSPHDVSVGGPTLAAQAIRTGLVDEIQLLVVPIVLGGGIQVLPSKVHGGSSHQLRSEHVFDEYLHHHGRPLGLAETSEPIIVSTITIARSCFVLVPKSLVPRRSGGIGADSKRTRTFEIRIDSSWLKLRA